MLARAPTSGRAESVPDARNEEKERKFAGLGRDGSARCILRNARCRGGVRTMERALRHAIAGGGRILRESMAPRPPPPVLRICNTVGKPLTAGRAAISPCVIFSNFYTFRVDKYSKITHGVIGFRHRRPEHARSRDSDRTAKPERTWEKAGVAPPSRRAPRDRRAGALVCGPAFAIPATVVRAGRR